LFVCLFVCFFTSLYLLCCSLFWSPYLFQHCYVILFFLWFSHSFCFIPSSFAHISLYLFSFCLYIFSFWLLYWLLFALSSSVPISLSLLLWKR
jgi:hypothetical protein